MPRNLSELTLKVNDFFPNYVKEMQVVALLESPLKVMCYFGNFITLLVYLSGVNVCIFNSTKECTFM